MPLSKKTSVINVILMLMSMLLLSNCAAVDYFKNQQNTKPVNLNKTPAQWQATLPHDGKITDLSHWWQQFNDPVLSQLIGSAQNVNADIATAQAKIIAAQSAVATQNASLYPNVTADANANRSHQGLSFPSSTTASAAINASWELDIWGKNKAAKNAEEAKLIGAQALWHDARIIVAAETAKQYMNYRLCENLVNTAKLNAESVSETARLSHLSAKAGFLAPASASQADAQAADATNQLLKQQLQCVLLVKSMVAMTAMPELELRQALDNNKLARPTTVAINVDNVPAKVLTQRPDVLNAERNVAAASFEVIGTQKQRYPTLSLAGNIGFAYDSVTASQRTGRLRASDGLTWSIGPVAISLPIFDAGLRKANLNAAVAQYDAAKVVYESVARNAVREVEEALSILNSTELRLNDVTNSAAGFKISLEATQTRYNANLANLFDLEDARRASLQADINVFSLRNERLLAWISLYRALGGGWKLADNNTAQLSKKLLLERSLNTVVDSQIIDKTGDQTDIDKANFDHENVDSTKLETIETKIEEKIAN